MSEAMFSKRAKERAATNNKADELVFYTLTPKTALYLALKRMSKLATGNDSDDDAFEWLQSEITIARRDLDDAALEAKEQRDTSRLERARELHKKGLL